MYVILVYDFGERTSLQKMLKLCRKYLNWITKFRI